MEVGKLLSDYGLPGIIIFVLGGVVITLYKENRTLIKQLFEVQEQRRLEALEVQKEVSLTMQTFSQSTKMLIDKIQIARGEREA